MNADVVVVGGGLAALETALALKRQRPRASVNVIGGETDVIYRPSLVYLPATGVAPPRIPFRSLLTNAGVDVVAARAESVDLGTKQVRLNGGTTIGYEQLIVASGATADRDRLPGAREHALFPCDQDDAAEFANQVRSGPLSVAVLFGWERPGPGLEYAAWIAARRPAISLTAIDGDGTLDRRFGHRATAKINDIFERRGARLVMGQRLVRFDERRVQLEQGTIDADVIAVATPLRGNSCWLPGSLLDARGRLRVDDAMQAAPGVFGIGDVVAVPEEYRLSPTLMSIRATTPGLVRNVIAALDGDRPRPVLRRLPDMMGPDLAGTAVFVRDRRLVPGGRLMHWMFKAMVERRYLRSRKAVS